MTYPDPDGEDILEGLDADPWEREQLREVLEEVGAEGYGEDSDGNPDEDGPWHDRLEQAGAALDDSAAREARRLEEDASDSLSLRPTDEVRAARALDRIGRGTYTQPEQLRPARDAGGLFAVSCGEALDEFGHCASRFHGPSCHTVAEAAAATGSYEEAEAWNAQLNGQPSAVDVAAAQAQLGLSNEPLDLSGAEPRDPLGIDFDDLLDDGQRQPYEQLRDRLFHEMALRDQLPRERRPDAPDTAAIRAALGI